MNFLAVVRHGQYDYDTGLLTQQGQQQMRNLASRLQDKFPEGARVRLLSSTAPRGKGSAEIFAEVLGVAPEFHDILWSGADSPRRQETARVVHLVQAAQEEQADVVILITHLEYTESVPNKFGHAVLGTDHFPMEEVEKGQAWLIDCRAKTCVRV